MAVQWHLSTLQTSWVTGAAILGAFIGAFVFGRIADVIGRKKVYVTVAVIMIIGAIASALAPDFLFLVVARLVLGFGIGGDYPVSAVFMSEYSNRHDRVDWSAWSSPCKRWASLSVRWWPFCCCPPASETR